MALVVPRRHEDRLLEHSLRREHRGMRAGCRLPVLDGSLRDERRRFGRHADHLGSGARLSTCLVPGGSSHRVRECRESRDGSWGVRDGSSESLHGRHRRLRRQPGFERPGWQRLLSELVAGRRAARLRRHPERGLGHLGRERRRHGRARHRWSRWVCGRSRLVARREADRLRRVSHDRRLQPTERALRHAPRRLGGPTPIQQGSRQVRGGRRHRLAARAGIGGHPGLDAQPGLGVGFRPDPDRIVARLCQRGDVRLRIRVDLLLQRISGGLDHAPRSGERREASSHLDWRRLPNVGDRRRRAHRGERQPVARGGRRRSR